MWTYILILVLASNRVMSDQELYEPLEIYLICHSHTDAGWAQTYDSYYNGVKGIFRSMVDALWMNHDYKFNWSDSNFLARWY